MAIAVRSLSKASAGSGSVSPAVPTGTASGDFLIAIQKQDSDAITGGSFAAMTAPAGWTLVADSSAVSTAAGIAKVWKKTATASEGASYTFAGATGSTHYVQVLCITGSTNTVNVGPVWSRPAAGTYTSLVAPSATATAAGLQLSLWDMQGVPSSAYTITAPAGFTGVSTVDPGVYQADLVGYKTVASGATGTATATGSSSTTAATTLGYLTMTMVVTAAGGVTGAVTGSTTYGGTVAGSVSHPKMSTLVDTFGTADTATWSGYGGGPTVSAGQLNIVPTTGYPSLITTGQYDLIGSYAAVQLVSPPAVGTGTTQAYVLQLRLDGNNLVQWFYGAGNMLADYVVGGGETPLSTVAYSSTTHAWLRIREASGTIFWDTSADGVTWNNAASLANPFALTALNVYVAAGYYGTEPTPGTLVLDNLNNLPIAGTVTGATVVGGTVSGSVAAGTIIGSVTGGTTVGGTVVGRVGAVGAVAGGTTAGGTTSSGALGVVGQVTGGTVAGGTVASVVAGTGTVAGGTVTGGTVAGQLGLFGAVAGATTSSATTAGQLGRVGAVTGGTTYSGFVAASGQVTGGTTYGGTVTATIATGVLAAITGATSVTATTTGQLGVVSAIVGGTSDATAVSAMVGVSANVVSATAVSATVVGAVGTARSVAGPATAVSATVTGGVTVNLAASVSATAVSATGVVSATVGVSATAMSATTMSATVTGAVAGGVVSATVSAIPVMYGGTVSATTGVAVSATGGTVAGGVVFGRVGKRSAVAGSTTYSGTLGIDAMAPGSIYGARVLTGGPAATSVGVGGPRATLKA